MIVETTLDLDGLRHIVHRQPVKRVSRIEFNNSMYWLKRPERRSWLSRLQKGSPMKAFQRELNAFRELAQRGLPIAEIVDMGNDYLVTRDAGIPLSKLARKSDHPQADLQCAFRSAALALHKIHAADMALGRPSLKDSLWDGERITFIDLEMFGAIRNLRAAQVLDVLLFSFSCFAIANRSMPHIDEALALYRTLDSRHIWDTANLWLRRTRFLVLCLRPIQALRQSRELDAIAVMYQHLGAFDPSTSRSCNSS